MRKVTFGVANSLDNYIARKDGAIDWLLWSDEASAIMADSWKTIDTIVMGRRTYEFALSAGMPTMAGVKTYVLSRALKQRTDDKVEIISEDAVEFVGKLKQESGKDIFIMSGGLLAKPLFEARLDRRTQHECSSSIAWLRNSSVL